MKLIVGLGNPGSKYEFTRHNLGSRVLESFIGQEVSAHLYLPRALMNLVGSELAEQLRFHHLSPADLLVIHDDLDLPLGEMRVQTGRSSAGHHGIDSIINELGTNAFWRLRLGVGPRGEVPGEKFVLQKFHQDEEDRMPSIIKEAEEKVKSWLKEQS